MLALGGRGNQLLEVPGLVVVVPPLRDGVHDHGGDGDVGGGAANGVVQQQHNGQLQQADKRTADIRRPGVAL